jgi:hypothetical protein
MPDFPLDGRGFEPKPGPDEARLFAFAASPIAVWVRTPTIAMTQG